MALNLGETGKDIFNTGLGIAKMAVWADNPVTQIATNIVIIIAASLSSFVTWGAGLIIAAFALIFLVVGIVRLILSMWG